MSWNTVTWRMLSECKLLMLNRVYDRKMPFSCQKWVYCIELGSGQIVS